MVRSLVTDRLIAPNHVRIILVGATLQCVLLAVTLRVERAPVTLLYVGSPFCGLLAGAGTDGLWPESVSNGGLATAAGATAYFVASVLYALALTYVQNGVFAPQIIVSLVGLVAAFSVPLLLFAGLVGGYVGHCLRAALG